MSKSILTAAAVAVFSFVAFEGAYAAETDVSSTKGFAATPEVATEKGFAADQSLSNEKTQNNKDVSGEKQSHRGPGKY